jgi:hypothetical protein
MQSKQLPSRNNYSKYKKTAASFLKVTAIGASVAFFNTDATLAQDVMIGLGTSVGSMLATMAVKYTVGNRILENIKHGLEEGKQAAQLFQRDNKIAEFIKDQYNRGTAIGKRAGNTAAQGCFFALITTAASIAGGVAGYKLAKSTILDKKTDDTSSKSVIVFLHNDETDKYTVPFFGSVQPA